jgi:hypothetical protein
MMGVRPNRRSEEYLASHCEGMLESGSSGREEDGLLHALWHSRTDRLTTGTSGETKAMAQATLRRFDLPVYN